ncbi:galactosyltransferase-related protein [Streptomyces cinnabarinus]|uniref:Galactosyltransferase-related protein n=1 Tax=Streptomyces cinnabarinus TaxID=67287 RepID=A0ABY7K547_9ACTN|nr:galactosyltransferase-related protein [Streptomyces cinnabarinus]WAZ19633.1 galactosyltransferase-related protein [Streptomyces cinnabarinus]
MMSRLPQEPATRASAVADALVIHADHGAREANPYYWHRVQERTADLLKEIQSHGDTELVLAADELVADPGSTEAWRRVRDRVTPKARAPFVDIACDIKDRSRFGYHLGDAYDRTATADPDWRSWPPNPPAPAPDDAPVTQIVITFRDQSEDGVRARNLVACLAALADQTMPREQYQVTVVESDTTPRWRETVLKYADEWLFAFSDRPFNKSWGTNCGVLRSARRAPYLCLLDADALVDRDFVRRNTERFRRAGSGAFMCFRDLLYLDAPASAAAVRERCVEGKPEADADRLRWFAVQRSPGLCVWLRRDVFDSVNGMDERFEGWGREDIDFVLRVQLATAFDQYDDRMLHLYHPSSGQLKNGQTVNYHIPLLSWTPAEPIGRLERFSG